MKKAIFTILVFGLVLTGCGKQGEEVVVNEGTQNTEQGTLQEGGQAQNTEQEAEQNEDSVITGNDVIKVFGVEEGDNLVSPVTIRGEGSAFENNLIVELRNNKHETLVKEFTTIKSAEVGKSGPFEITLNFEFNNTKEGYLAVYEQSAKDGSELNLVEIAVRFNDDTEITDNSKQTTEDWQTYRDEEYGFEFSHPSYDYFYKSKDNKFYQFGYRKDDEYRNPVNTLSISIIDNENASDWVNSVKAEIIENSMEGPNFVEPIYNEQEEVINGVKMYKFWFARGIGIDAAYCIFEKDNNVFEIKYGSIEHEKVISTFKFIDSDWLTYRNEKYGYSIEYPSDWSLRDSLTSCNEILNNEDLEFIVLQDFDVPAECGYSGIGGTGLAITINSEDKDINSFDAWEEEYKNKAGEGEVVKNLGEKNWGSLKGREYSIYCDSVKCEGIAMYPNHLYVFFNENVFYTFDFFVQYASLDDYNDIINQVISTFKFIN